MIVDRQTHRYRQTDARHKFTILRFHVGGGVLNEKQRTSSAVLAIASVVTLYHLQGKVLSEPVNATNDCFPKYEPVSTDMVLFTHMIDMNVLNALGLYSVSQKLLPPMFSDNISPND